MTLAMNITSTPEQVRHACEALHGLCEQAGMARTEVYQFELCLAEALNNIIEHAFGGKQDHSIHIDLSVDQDYVAADVTYPTQQQWPAELLLEATLPMPIDDELPERGFGNYLIKHLMDQIDITHQDGQTKIYFAKRREP